MQKCLLMLLDARSQVTAMIGCDKTKLLALSVLLPLGVKAFFAPVHHLGWRAGRVLSRRGMTMAVHRAHREGVPLNNQFPDLISSHKLNTHSLLEAPLHYSSFLYLSLDRDQDFAVWPAGYETLSRVASESKTKMQVAHVPMNVSRDLSFELAERIITILDRMEGPTLIASASGRRASAVKSLYMALCGGLSPEQTIRLAEANNAPFIECPALREWVEAVIARTKLTHHLALHQLHSDSDSANAFVVGCCETMEGVLIDPKDESLYAAHHDLMGLQLRYIFHTKTGRLRLVETTPSNDFVQCRDADQIRFGNNRVLEVRQIDGPRGRRFMLVSDDRSMAFTGDLVTSLRSADSAPVKDEHTALDLYDSLSSRLLSLPRESMLFHSSGPTTTIAAEKSTSRLLGQSRRVFVHRVLASGGTSPRENRRDKTLLSS